MLAPGYVKMLQILATLSDDFHSRISDCRKPGDINMDKTRIAKQEVVYGASIDPTTFEGEVLKISTQI